MAKPIFNNDEPREVMDARQAAAYLGVDTATLRQLARGQNLPAFKLGRVWRFKKSFLDQWMHRQILENSDRYYVRNAAHEALANSADERLDAMLISGRTDA